MNKSSGLHLTDFVERPDFGQRGESINVRANFFRVSCLPDSTIVHYHITIEPEVPPSVNREIYQIFEQKINQKAAFDGKRNVFSPTPLRFNTSLKGDTSSFLIELPDGRNASISKSFRQYTIKIKEVNKITMEALHLFLQGQAQQSPCMNAIMALDVVMRHRPSMKYTTVGRSFFTHNCSEYLSEGAVEAWQGYYQSVRPAQGQMMVNIDISATAFYRPGSLLDRLTQILHCRTQMQIPQYLDEIKCRQLDQIYKGVKFRVTHRGKENRIYKIQKFTRQGADKITFKYGDTNITVKEYFKNNYQQLYLPTCPCIVDHKGNYFPIEVCDVIMGQRYQKKLDEKQTADMIKFTCQTPAVRANKIQKGTTIFDIRDNEHMKAFGLGVDGEMVKILARVLDPPDVNYHSSSSKPPSCKPQNGTWNLRNKKLPIAMSVSSLSVVVFGPCSGSTGNRIDEFIRKLADTAKELGMSIAKNPPVLNVKKTNIVSHVLDVLKRASNMAREQYKRDAQLIICVLSDNDSSVYSSIKMVGDTEISVRTQCIQSKFTNSPKQQYCANVCLKINAKLGGVNAILGPKAIPFISEKPTIVFGADVTHPGANDTTSSSIAAVCASMDRYVAKYHSLIREQNNRVEIIVDLEDMVKQLLQSFYQTTGRKPESILFYRDGVSEGQFPEVQQKEIKAIENACKIIETSYRPKITFIIVQKRHHVRFFPISISDRSGNCPAGTVVDNVITHPFEFDFYLQSHAGIQGTSRPTHYHVLCDENKFTADGLQQLTYNLCHLYARSTRTVSVVPSVYYADLLCTRARCYAFHSANTESSSENRGRPLSQVNKVRKIMLV